MRRRRRRRMRKGKFFYYYRNQSLLFIEYVLSIECVLSTYFVQKP
jgi:hypothetical protein